MTPAIYTLLSLSIPPFLYGLLIWLVIECSHASATGYSSPPFSTRAISYRLQCPARSTPRPALQPRATSRSCVLPSRAESMLFRQSPSRLYRPVPRNRVSIERSRVREYVATLCRRLPLFFPIGFLTRAAGLGHYDHPDHLYHHLPSTNQSWPGIRITGYIHHPLHQPFLGAS